MGECKHIEYKVRSITETRVEAYCTGCKRNMTSTLEKWDKMSLLFHFSNDVCEGCDHVSKCWDSDLRVMPDPNVMKYYCKKGAGYCFPGELDLTSRLTIDEIERRESNTFGS